MSEVIVNEDVKTDKVDISNVKTDTDPVVVKTDNNVPITRLNEVIEQRNDLRLKIKGLEDAEILRKEDNKKKAGEFEDLFNTEKTEHAKTKETAEKWTSYEKERREFLMAKIPEKVRDIYDGISLVKLEKAVETITKDGSLGVNVGDPARHTDLTTTERKSIFGGSSKEKREKHQSLIDSYKK